MLLPKRKLNLAFMHERLLQYEREVLGIERVKSFRELLNEIKKVDLYLFDEEDAIVVIENPDKNSEYHYFMVHYRFVDGRLQEMKRWGQRTHYFGNTSHQIIRELNYFMVPGGRDIYHISWDCCGSIYNYKTCEFVVEKNIFDGISTTNRLAGINHAIPEVNYLKEHECFLANFELESEYQEDDIIYYTNPITKEDMSYAFGSSEVYFAFLNIDGSIKGNELLRGRNLSRIKNTIPLDGYESLEQFKFLRIKELTEEKNKVRNAYFERLNLENKEFISPYQDDEIMKLLKIKNKDKMQ